MFKEELTCRFLLLIWIGYEIFGRPALSAFANIADWSSTVASSVASVF